MANFEGARVACGIVSAGISFGRGAAEPCGEWGGG